MALSITDGFELIGLAGMSSEKLAETILRNRFSNGVGAADLDFAVASCRTVICWQIEGAVFKRLKRLI